MMSEPIPSRTLADDLLDGAAAAAEFLGINRRTIYRLTESGDLPCVRMGARIYYRKSELERTFGGPTPSGLKAIAMGSPTFIPMTQRRPVGQFVFSELASIVMKASKEPSERFSACCANIKYLQRQVLGTPGVGQGRRALYDPEEVWLFLFARELQLIGMTAGQIVPVFELHKDAFLEAVKSDEPLVIPIEYAGRTASIAMDVPALIEAVREFSPLFGE